MKLKVPYYSQYEDIKDKVWRDRACGLVCLKMVLDFNKIKTPEIGEFLKIALDKGTYHEFNGWIHDKIVELAKDFGMEACRKEEMENEQELKDFLDGGNPVIVSISAKRFLEEFESKFHQVVLTGFKLDNCELKGFYYNDPDYQGEEGKGLFVDRETFGKYWRKMAIFVHKIG